MSDEYSADTSAPVSTPDAPAIDPASEIVAERRHTTLSQLAKSEDISDFAQERQDQAAAIDRGEELPQERQNQWYRRASAALRDAANEAAGIQTNGQQPQQLPPQQYSEEGYQPSDPVEYARKEGAAAQRVSAYFGDNQARKQQIVDWGQAMDPESHVAAWLIENESTQAPQIMERLADNPEAWRQIAELTPTQRTRWLSALEGHLATEQSYVRQLAQQQQQWSQQARVSRAPPPINAPRGGGALPPRDAHALARSDDVSSYVTLRRQQEKRSR